MKGMKKTNGEFQSNNVCRVMNNVQHIGNMCTVTTAEIKSMRKNQKITHKTSRVSAMKIVAIISMVLGLVTLLFVFAQAYFMDNHEIYPQYVLISFEVWEILFAVGFGVLMGGIGLLHRSS